MARWTFGVELELPDIDVRAKLPREWSWSTTDYTIVNSNGVANDPKRQLILEGGELNSSVYDDVDTALQDVGDIWQRLNPGYNYRSNLHVHVRIPGIKDDLRMLKLIAAYSRSHLPSRWKRIDPLDGLGGTPENPISLKEMPGALLRSRHSESSRHFFITDARHAARMAATTLEGMLAAEVPASKADGHPLWALSSREAVNLRSLRKHGTIEFRCFAAPRTPQHVHSAMRFAEMWLDCAIYGGDPDSAVNRYGHLLPRQERFEQRLEDGWHNTNLQHNSREVVAARLRALGVSYV
jgi:hypothetical protein